MPDPRATYERNARLYDLWEVPAELLLFRRWRRTLFSLVRARNVLEVGVGTGKNISYYPGAAQVVAVDFSERMLARARSRAARLGRSVRFELMDIERLGFPDGTFDAAAATFVFCSVPDALRGLSEVRRVLRPGAKLFMLEHVRPGGRWAGGVFDLLNPLAVRLSGANINRPTVDTVRRAGFRIELDENLLGGVFRRIIAVVPLPATEYELVGRTRSTAMAAAFGPDAASDIIGAYACMHRGHVETVPSMAAPPSRLPAGGLFGASRWLFRLLRTAKHGIMGHRRGG